MKIRSRQPELIDLGSEHYTQHEYNHCLYQLGRIGKYLGANNAILKTFPHNINSILDVGCGGGYFAMQLALKFKNAQVTGIDLNSDAITHAIKQNAHLNNIKFLLSKTPELNEPEKSYDIVTATLVCHHLSDEEIIDFLKRAKVVARKNIIINDLQRSRVSYFFASIIMPLFFNNRLVKNDSLLSIKKAFTYSDWIFYLKAAGISPSNYSIRWHWPFRWIIKINVV
ncbi:MAG: methyltransferase domain-containing protein [Candidatus Babeliales bacterium]|nr:methyltransferase domain-containing protein [Candidatus Babeliales bacterium]